MQNVAKFVYYLEFGSMPLWHSAYESYDTLKALTQVWFPIPNNTCEL